MQQLHGRRWSPTSKGSTGWPTVSLRPTCSVARMLYPRRARNLTPTLPVTQTLTLTLTFAYAAATTATT